MKTRRLFTGLYAWFREKQSRLLILLVLASVLVRLPFLARPLSGHHEWLTATSFVHVVNFYEQGFRKLHFSPSVSFPLPADKNIPFYMNLGDQNGNMYYLSFPPFAFILPAVLFRALSFPPTVTGLRIFNLILHVLCCLVLYRVLVRFSGLDRKKETVALAGFLVYLFAPATLWFQSNIYMSDMTVQIFFLVCIWSWLEYFRGASRHPLWLAVFALSNFAMVYTEWLGVFFAVAAGALALFRVRSFRWKSVLPFLIVLAVTAAAPLVLTVWQYSLISGWQDLRNYWFSKFTFRTGDPNYASGGMGFTNIMAWLNILVNYIGGFLPYLVLTGILIGRSASLKTRKSFLNPAVRDAVGLSLVPVLLHHAVFFNFTSVHDFSVLKAAVVLAILTALLYHKYLSGRPFRREALLWTAVTAFAVIQFWAINGVGAHGRYQVAGEAIRKAARDDEVVFVTGLPLPADPQYMAYTRRNLAGWETEDRAAALLQKNNTSRGVLFTIGDSGILKTGRFALTNNKIVFKDGR